MVDHDKTYGPMRPWMRVLLVSSLALNLLFVGLAVGTAMRFGGPDRRPPPSVGAALYRSLPDDDRRALRSDIRRLRGAQDHRARHRDEARQVANALRAEPFDAAALETLVIGHLNDRNGGLAEVQSAWVARIAAMDRAARLDYAERLTEAFDRPARKKKWFGRWRD